MRDKTNVRDSILGLTFINQLRPVDYKWNYRESYVEISETTKIVDVISIDPITGVETVTQTPTIVFERTLKPNDGSNARNRYHHGLIAQEVKTVIDNTSTDFGGYQDHTINGGGDVLTIGYSEFIAPLIKSVQELSARVKALELINTTLTANNS